MLRTCKCRVKVVPGEVQQRADLSCPAAPFLLSDAPEVAAQLPSQRTQNYRIAELLTCWFVSKSTAQRAAVLSVWPLVSHLHITTCAVCVGVQVRWVKALASRHTLASSLTTAAPTFGAVCSECYQNSGTHSLGVRSAYRCHV